MNDEEKRRRKIAKKLGISPSEVKLDTFSGQTIIDESLLSEKECEELLRGHFVSGVGCVTTEEEQPDGSKVYKKPSLKVYRKEKKKKPEETAKGETFVSKEEVV